MNFEVYYKLPEHIQQKTQEFDSVHFDTEEAENPEFEEEIAEHYFALNFAYVIAFENNEIIGTSHLKRREIEFEGVTVILGGQSGITVRKDKRGQGVGKALLLKSLEVFQKAECDIAFLNTDLETLGPIFQKVGYQIYPKKYFYYGRSGQKHSDNNAMLAPVCSPTWFEKIMNSVTNLNIGESNI